jgi:hypothetical protein
MPHDDDPPTGGTQLQFDSVMRPNSSSADGVLAVECAGCHQPIQTKYFDVNGRFVCDRCRRTIEAFAEEPKGVQPLARAAIFGLGAGIAGAAVYYAVLAIAHLEIGIVAILIGYMVGAGVRKGAQGRGGVRLQIIAVALTYASVAMAYLPIAIQGVAAARSARAARATTPGSTQETSPANTGRPVAAAPRTADGGKPAVPPTLSQLLAAIGMLVGFTLALPVLVIVGGFPASLLSALIVFFGMRQAWRMTAAPTVIVLGPYRVGAAAASA